MTSGKGTHSRAVSLLAAVLVFSAAFAAPSFAADAGALSGAVHDPNGHGVAGAMVTLNSVAIARSTTVYADEQGRFQMPALEPGEYGLRVRRPGYKTIERSGVAIGATTPALYLTMEIETDPNELAWQLPANRWTPLVLEKLSSDAHRTEFVHQCTFCHQQGDWATRIQRSNSDWNDILGRMERMGAGLSPGLRAELPAALNAAWDEKNYRKELTEPEFIPPPPPRGRAMGAVVTEWNLGIMTTALHDLAVHPDGSIWAVDTFNDKLYRLDPNTNQREEVAIPAGDSPVGGVFAGTGFLLPKDIATRVGPHSLQIAGDGTIWVTLCIGNKIGHYDPRSRKWTVYKQKEGLYPHTLRIDKKGRVWYTLAVSNNVGMIDPKTGEQRTYYPPAATWSQALTARMMPLAMWAIKHLGLKPPSGGGETSGPVPYGIDVAPDGAVWFSQLNARHIGRIDPQTGAIKMIETPFSGPRRMRFDSKGNLWIPGFSSNLLAKYDPATGKFKTWKMPTGGVETPYALNIDKRTDTIWVCGTASDTLMSFDPKTEQFTIYPLPTPVTFTREIDFDKDGNIWTSDSNIPTWQIEQPLPVVIRIKPGAEQGGEVAKK